MKRIFTVILLLYGCLTGLAQQPYPSAPAPANIVRLEYVVDANIPYGSGTAIAVTPGTNLANLNVALNLTGVPAGVRTLYIRSQDANGKWSITQSSAFNNGAIPNYPVAPAPSNMVRLEYVFDANIPYGSGTAIPVTPGTNLENLNIPINLTGVPPGIRTLYIRSQDAGGRWSITHQNSFSNGAVPNYPAAPPALQNIVQIEYFVDNDPGIGKAIALAFNAGTQLANIMAQINMAGLTNGGHRLGWRSREENGAWSHTVFLNFNITSPTASPAIVVNSVSKQVFCAGDSLEMGLHVVGNYNPGNTFQVQISDASGSFANPTETGSPIGIGNQILKIKLPAHLPDGTGYKLRVNSTNPAAVGVPNKTELTIRDRPYAATITGLNKVNGGFTHPYAVPAVASSSFNWVVQQGSQVSGGTTNAITANWPIPGADSVNGRLAAIETNQFGCIGDTSLLSPVTIYRLDIGDTAASSVCKGNMLIVKTGITGSFANGNILTAQLSNASGNFSSPTATATLNFSRNGVNQLATINLPIPANLPNGNGYRVRILSSNPAFIGDSTGNIAIQKPNIGNDLTGVYCQGLGYNLTQHYTNNTIAYTYFSNAFSPVSRPDSIQAGIYRVIGKNNFGCPDTAQVTVTENPKPDLGADTSLFHVCVGEKSDLTPLYNTSGLTAVWNTNTPSSVPPGNYQLIVTNSFGCRDTAIASVILPTAIWTGAVSTDWHTAGNWSNGKVPDVKTHVIIATSTPRACIISTANAEAASVQLKSPGSLQQINGRQLIIQAKCAILPSP